MHVSLTRRHFGGSILAASVAAGVAAVAAPRLALGQAAAFANPHLLMTVEELLPLAEMAGEDGRARYADQGIVLVDVRPADAYADGHIPGARQLDPNAVAASAAPISGALKSDAEIAGLMGALGIDAEARVVLYDDRGGFHASRMLWLLEHMGHQNVALLDGGLNRWLAVDGPVSTVAPAIEARAFAPSIMPRRIASADYVLQHRDDPETVVVDVRPPKMFAAGHIPWAKNIPWKDNLTEDATFRSAADLADHFAGHDVTPERNAVIHCENGLASSHSYVALRLLGYPRVRVYHRSWAEWGSSDDLPKATGA